MVVPPGGQGSERVNGGGRGRSRYLTVFILLWPVNIHAIRAKHLLAAGNPVVSYKHAHVASTSSSKIHASVTQPSTH